MAGAALLSQVEGLLEQCVDEYGDNPRVQQLLDDTRSVMEEMRAGGADAPNGEETAEPPGMDAAEGEEPPALADIVPKDFKSMDQANNAARDKLKANRKAKAKSDMPDEEQPDEKAKKRKAKAE